MLARHLIISKVTNKPLLLNFISNWRHLSRSMSSEETTKIAVCQLTSTEDKNKNFESLRNLLTKAADNNAKIAFFPECTDYVASTSTKSVEFAETLDGPLMTSYRSLAKEKDIWISIGGFHEKSENDKLNNSHVLIDNNGEICSVYRKLHLFNVSLPDEGINLQESKYVNGGDIIQAPVKTPAGLIGLSICYDMRFPELSTHLRKMGADILTFPSAFTTSTGKAHWSTLLKARAIENQCYVVAAAQFGIHNSKRTSHGHSIIFDPWGKIVAECRPFSENCGKSEDESLAFAEIDLKYLQKVRKQMPVFQHRRDDVYTLQLNHQPKNSLDDNNYMFGKVVIPSSTVFLRSKHVYAFTNIRCVVPGHVLITSLRSANRLEDLNSEELADFFDVVVRVQKVMERVQSTDSSTICIQDGKHAGQTVPQVHCHILPRKANDFERNDDIYSELAKHDRDDNPNPLRSNDEMSEEAFMLRNYF